MFEFDILIVQGGMRAYICDHDTSPPGLILYLVATCNAYCCGLKFCWLACCRAVTLEKKQTKMLYR